MAICEVQQQTQEAEETLSHGLDALNQSLSDTIASDALSSPTNMANYMGQMAAAMNKLSALESFVIQVHFLSSRLWKFKHGNIIPSKPQTEYIGYIVLEWQLQYTTPYNNILKPLDQKIKKPVAYNIYTYIYVLSIVGPYDGNMLLAIFG